MRYGEKITLAIETAGREPGLSLLANSREIDCWCAGENQSASESLLPAICVLLERNGLGIEQVDILAVSKGPGSFTGVRVGLATAKGIGSGVKSAIVGVSVLEALAVSAETSGLVGSIIHAGRGEFFAQDFLCEGFYKALEASEPRLLKKDEVLHEVNIKDYKSIVCEVRAYEELSVSAASVEFISRTGSFAKYIGLAGFEKVSREGMSADDLQPIYVREADFRMPKTNL
jgi:universal bacterial protein YeaZ